MRLTVCSCRLPLSRPFRAAVCGGLLAALALAGGCHSVPARLGTADSPKARRSVAAWYEYKAGRSAEEIVPLADILSSISVHGELPPPEFVAACHAAGIRVYRLMPGAAGCFDTPASREATVRQFVGLCRSNGFDGIELDYQALGPEWRERFSEFLAMASAALHADGRKLATTVFVPPAPDRTAAFIYDPAVIARTCDEIRVMCYDLHMALALYGPWQGSTPHVGFGPASTAPWGREAMRYWLDRVPREKLRMALPAYGNDYETLPHGRGAQIYAPVPPTPAGTTNECIWLEYEQLHVYRYLASDGRPHLFFASDTASTRAHLRTIDDLNLPGLVFWQFHAVPPQTWQAVRAWLRGP